VTVAARISQADMAYTPRTLAERWQCSESLIRKMVKAGQLQKLPLGALVRISADEVRRFECNTRSSDSEAGSLWSGETQESAAAEPSTPPIGRARKPRPGEFGKPGTVHRGPWAGS